MNDQQFQQRVTNSLPQSDVPALLADDYFWPDEPTTLEDTGLSPTLVESIICQRLLASGTTSGRNMAEAIGLPFGMADAILAGLRTRQYVTHVRSAPLNDYYYGLTENGQQRVLQLQKAFMYTGPAPVPLSDYLLSVEAQATQYEPIEYQQLSEALSGISFEPNWLNFLGPAVNSNGGIFLYGSPGNGKSTLAKCLTILKGESIWLPHAIIDDGVIIKLFDAAYHKPLAQTNDGIVSQDYDRRWIRVERPTVIVGGELTLDNLEIRHDPRSNICEAPLQLKSNCGSLLIDDFGRQRVAPEELLNRWIIPLENRIDFLTLPTGKKISVPFEQMVIFSTNLQPHDLVDEAFLRRVPFKIEITDPSPSEFALLFQRACVSMGFPWRPEVIKQLISGFFVPQQRALRRCYARDLLKQVQAYCAYRGEPLDLRIEYLQQACRNYFGTLGWGTSPNGGNPASRVGSTAAPSPEAQMAANTPPNPAKPAAQPLAAAVQVPAVNKVAGKPAEAQAVQPPQPPRQSAVDPVSGPQAAKDPLAASQAPAQRPPAPAPQQPVQTGPPAVQPAARQNGQVAQQPAAQQSATQQPAAQRPATQRPVAQRPATQRPVAQQHPAPRQPITQRPAAQQQPAPQQPAGNRPIPTGQAPPSGALPRVAVQAQVASHPAMPGQAPTGQATQHPVAPAQPATRQAAPAQPAQQQPVAGQAPLPNTANRQTTSNATPAERRAEPGIAPVPITEMPPSVQPAIPG